ncbi:MAG: TetM/TetW/TetO/TetS family tetracycline resistance ribosomal protection protein [Lachnospiraceae bacterium]|nr:TetM/TetW/TetO/TetS family tetracycline resistance ribosomal protection protein [Lachnospiraceae bacterium]
MEFANKNHNERLVLGILAHVDAGKTTLSEALLYHSGAIRRLGRVDKKDAYLDTDEVERARGITIYSKQAEFTRSLPCERERTYTLLDTPGHADFSPEMERTLVVLDLAILVVSAADGVNGQVRNLWSLLKHYKVPTLIFVNKMDQIRFEDEKETRKAALLAAMKDELSLNCIAFDAKSPEDLKKRLKETDVQENLALCREELLNRVMEGGQVTEEDFPDLIEKRELFPVFFGAALLPEGVDVLLAAMDAWVREPLRREEFGAKVFKVTRDPAGERLTWVKLTGGSLSVRTELSYVPFLKSGEENENPLLKEKVNQIRIYSGEKYSTESQIGPGAVAALLGLSATYAGQGLGLEEDSGEGLMVPILTWKLILPNGADPYKAYRELSILAEEEPELSVSYNEQKKEITAAFMGEVQREILKGTVRKRFGMDIGFERPSVIYRETIAAPSEGVGHFEPLRHYAEVHLLLEPLDPGSGLVFESRCPVDALARNWQRLVLTHLKERKHKGVLTGAELTDMKITLIAGRAHEKHTEGGDFRQATYRAVRQGLMMAENVLLEPCYRFRVELPQENLGRLLNDLTLMGASFGAPEGDGSKALVTGTAPVKDFGDYAEKLASYTKGRGSLSFSMSGYKPCRNAQEVIEEIGYDPEADKRNPASSVFCSHGVGTIVPWQAVRDYMHIDSGWRPGADYKPAAGQEVSRAGALEENAPIGYGTAGQKIPERPGKETDTRSFKEKERDSFAAEDELRAIFERTYGPIRSNPGSRPENEKRTVKAEVPERYKKPRPKAEKEYLLVDGYNIIFAWEELRKLAGEDLKAARDRLLDILSDYAGYEKKNLICVFDAYKVAGGTEQVYRYHNIDVIFTKEAETADQYIEKAAHELSRRYSVAVATSDAIEQVIVFGAGALRLSARNFEDMVRASRREMKERYLDGSGAASLPLREGLADKLQGIFPKK